MGIDGFWRSSDIMPTIRQSVTVTAFRQPDLFAPKDPPVPLAASERRKLLPLVSALLAETLTIIAEAETSDEDHA
jgi:hypothetical protein